MKTKYFFFLLIIIVPVFSQEFVGLGLELRDMEQTDTHDVYRYRVKSGGEFVFYYTPGNKEFQNQKTEAILNTFLPWKQMKIKTLTIRYSGQIAEIVIIPNSLVYNKMDIVKYIPSGLQFYYDANMEYDFRIFVNQWFLKIAGQYYSADKFLERLHSAVVDPAQFIQKNDPDYFLRALGEIDDQVDINTANIFRNEESLRNEFKEASEKFDLLLYETQQDYINRFRESDERFSLAKDYYDTLLKEAKDSYDAQLKEMRSEYLKEIESLSLELKEKYDAENEMTRKALLSLINKGIFFGPEAVNEKSLAEIRKMKEENSSLTVDQLREKAKALNLDISKKEIQFLLAVYFGEYETE